MHKPKFNSVAVIFAASVVLFAACSRHLIDDTGDRYGLTAPLDSLLTPLFPNGEPGAVVIVSRGDSILYNRSFGLARLDSLCAMTDSTMLNVASSTKTFTAAAIMKLVEQGKLTLDDKFVSFFPELSAEIFGKITLRHVLSHTSGIPDLRPRDNAEWNRYVSANVSIFGDGPDYRIYGREREFSRYLESLDSLAFEPGTSFERQDPPYMLLSAVIEKVTGEEFEAWMQKNIFAPAGIRYATYIDRTRPIVRMAHGYCRAEGEARSNVFRSKDGRWDEYDYGEADFFLTKADRGLYINALDFARWQHAFNKGNVLSDSMVSLFRRPVIAYEHAGEGCSYGINVLCGDEGMVKLYHRGRRGGFTAIEATYVEPDVCYVVLSNRNDWDMELLATAIERVLATCGLI